jgi:hypothetical protein
MQDTFYINEEVLLHAHLRCTAKVMEMEKPLLG